MKNMKISILGGDKRQCYLAKELIAEGFAVKTYANSMQERAESSLYEALDEVDVVILPYPLSPDGICLNCPSFDAVYLEEIFKIISENKIKKVFGGGVIERAKSLASSFGVDITDYGKNEALLIKNAHCTAEGAIEIAIKELPVTLKDATVCVIGYGRIGRILSKMLRLLGAEVLAVARKNVDFANMYTDDVKGFSYEKIAEPLRRSDLVFNTVPSLVLNEERLLYIDRKTKIVDLASAPGGVDHYSADKLGLQVICALSLPGKVSPKTAAMIIKETIIDELLDE